ncbi:MAG: type VI secretion system baseplate subunit TssE [Acidobacteria bacterium]|nr:type VI secretion system baseplate subunit TssE [Acidobacteriota bacterium]
MARYEPDVRITLSVLDRLLDFEPEAPADPPLSRARGVKMLRSSVRRDLEWLLNTRRLADDVPRELTEATRSVITFGLPDFLTANTKSSLDQGTVRRAIEDVIRHFEPRLFDVIVTLEEETKENPYGPTALRYRIEAKLRVDPAPEPIVFDTMFLEGTSGVTVRED